MEAVGAVVAAAEKARDLMPEPFVTPVAPAKPAPIDRETLIEAFGAARVVNSDFVALEGGWTVPRDDEAERMADVAIAEIIKAEGGLA